MFERKMWTDIEEDQLRKKTKVLFSDKKCEYIESNHELVVKNDEGGIICILEYGVNGKIICQRKEDNDEGWKN